MTITAPVEAALQFVEQKYAEYQAALVALGVAHAKLQQDYAARPAQIAAAQKAADALADSQPDTKP
jgi:hypothetical protein